MLLEPEALAALPRSEPASRSVLGGALLGLLSSLLGTGQSRLGALGLALLGPTLLEVALGVLVHCFGDLKSDASTRFAILIGEVGHYGLPRWVGVVYPGYVVDSVHHALPAIRGDRLVELGEQRIHVLPVILNRLT